MSEETKRIGPVKYARGYLGDAQVTLGKNYNGGGPTAFGGAREWPVVKLHVPFQEGNEWEARAFAEDLERWLVERLVK